MARTTSTLVGGIIELDTDIDAGPFIDTANELVTECCVDSNPDPAYTDARLELIERWLAAHFYAMLVKQVASESVRGVQEVFQFKVGMFLSATMYGQQAMALDTAGGLSRLNKQTENGTRRRVGKMTWEGTEAI